jgi:hypothetical protein
MSDDGKVDYARYSTAELHEALEVIDRARFPRNLANHTQELASRPASDALHRGTASNAEPLFDLRMTRRVFVAGWGLLALGAALAYWALARYDDLPNYQRLGALLPLSLGAAMLHVHTLRDMASASPPDQIRAAGSVLVLLLLVLGTLAWLAFAPGTRG